MKNNKRMNHYGCEIIDENSELVSKLGRTQESKGGKKK